MDEVSFGIATAALTLQSVMLQALVAKGLLTPSEAVEVVDKKAWTPLFRGPTMKPRTGRHRRHTTAWKASARPWQNWPTWHGRGDRTSRRRT